MLIAVIFSFLLEHNQQIIYFCSFITKPLLTDFLPFRDQKFGGVCAAGGLCTPGTACLSTYSVPVIGSLWSDGRMLVWFSIKASKKVTSARSEPPLWPGCTPQTWTLVNSNPRWNKRVLTCAFATHLVTLFNTIELPFITEQQQQKTVIPATTHLAMCEY